MIDGERITPLNSRAPVKGGYVLYWMQQAQRFDFNHALQYAVQEADRHDLGVVVAFCLVDDYPGANLRHYAFMMEGLRETVPRFREAGMQCLIVRGRPEDVIPLLSRDACLVVVDRGYLRHQVLWRTRVAARIECPLVKSRATIVVPVETASPKPSMPPGPSG
jgi:deoxyribodipyrimidine photo-lyase